MIITILKCVVVIVALAIVWFFGYVWGVKIAIKYATEKIVDAVMDIIEEQDGTAQAIDFAEKILKKINEIF